MRRNSILVWIAAGAMLFVGCSSKQYYAPKRTYAIKAKAHSYTGTIVALTRDGATLSDGHYIGKKGESNINLGKGYRYLSENENYVLAGNLKGVLKIIDKRTGEPIRAVALHEPIISAKIDRGIIAYVLNNNTFGIYQIADNRKVMESRSEQTYAIDTRAATPIFVGNLAVMPMLDGKLIIVDSNAPENAKVVYLSSAKNFNNIIFLDRIGDRIVSATPRSVVVLGDNGKREYEADVSDVAVSTKGIYLFSKEGEVIRLDSALKPLSKKKFKFAHFAAATTLGDKVYALDQQGSLIVLSSDLGKYRVYDVGAIDEPVFIKGDKLYKDGDVIDLNQLGYE